MPDPSAVPTPEQLRRLTEARHAALLRKWTTGTPRLTPGEMAEIAHLLPAAALANPPAPKAGYLHEYSHYAAKLGYDERNIKRWVKLGRQARDLPPFDEPPALLLWWRRMQAGGFLKQKPPDRVVNYGHAADHSGAAPPPAPGSPPRASETGFTPPAAPAPVIGFSQNIGSATLAQSVEKLRVTLARNQDRLDRAMSSEVLDEGLVASCQRTVEKILDLLRKAENDLFDMQRKRGELVPIVEVRTDLQTLLSSFRIMRERMEDNVCAALSALLTPAHLALVRAAVTAERLKEDQLLRAAKHWKEPADVRVVAA